MRLLFESGVSFVRRRYRLKKNRERKHKDSVLVLLRTSESGVRSHHQILSGVRVNVDGSEVVWRSQPQARSSISRYALEAGSTRLARKMNTYITSNMSELPTMLERQDTSEPMHVRIYMYKFAVTQIKVLIRLVAVATIYSRAASISFHACSGVATIREQRLFESGV